MDTNQCFHKNENMYHTIIMLATAGSRVTAAGGFK